MLENVNLEVLPKNKNNRVLGIIKFVSDNLMNTFYYDLFLKESEKDIVINHILSILHVENFNDLEIWRLNFRRLLWGDYKSLEETYGSMTDLEKTHIREKINSICSPKLVEVLSLDSKGFEEYFNRFEGMSVLDIKKHSLAENNIKAITNKVKATKTKDEILDELILKYDLKNLSYIKGIPVNRLDLVFLTLDYYIEEILIGLEKIDQPKLFGRGKLSLIILNSGDNYYQPETKTIFININKVNLFSEAYFHFLQDIILIEGKPLAHSYFKDIEVGDLDIEIELRNNIMNLIANNQQKDDWKIKRVLDLEDVVLKKIRTKYQGDVTGYVNQLYRVLLENISKSKTILEGNAFNKELAESLYIGLKDDIKEILKEFAVKKFFEDNPKLKNELLAYVSMFSLTILNNEKQDYWIVANHISDVVEMDKHWHIVSFIEKLDQIVHIAPQITPNNLIGKAFLAYINDFRDNEDEINLGINYPRLSFEIAKISKWFEDNIMLIGECMKNN